MRPYWTSEERHSAWLLLVSNVALTVVSVYMTVLFNQWYNVFYNTLQVKAKAEFFHQIGRFCVLAAISIAISVYQMYLNQTLQMRWRRWLTDTYLKVWLADRKYYYMQLKGNSTDNPDQRIADDLRLFVSDSLGLALGFLNAAVTLGSFIGILWSLSGPLGIPLAGTTYVVYGYMVWVAIGYAIVGTWFTHKIGKPLILLNFNQQRYEADFRFNLMHFRENTEAVALYRGEEDELRGFHARFAAVLDNWWAIIRRQKFLTWFTAGYDQAAVVFPFVVGASRYFSGGIQLGGLVQISNAFGQVQGALSWLIGAYTEFASWKATVDRLTSFRSAICAAGDKKRVGTGPAVVANSTIEDVELRDLGLKLPSGRVLLSGINVSIKRGEWVLVKGPSGLGKSTLFRAIAGIWPFGAGVIRTPQRSELLFLPQRPYFPIGSMREALSYPASTERFTDAAVTAVLTAAGLDGFFEGLDQQQNWTQQLSGGEQQRVAIARALLHKPAWLFLDEATSALDEQSEERVYQLLAEWLPHTTVISIAHRAALSEFHSRVLEVKLDRDANARMMDSGLAPIASMPSDAEHDDSSRC